MVHRPLTLVVPTRPSHRPPDAPAGNGLLLARAADGLTNGLLLFDGTANVVATNAAARLLLADSPDARLVPTPDPSAGCARLRLTDPASQSRLESSIRAMARRAADADRYPADPDDAPPAFAVGRIDGRPRLSLRLTMVPAAAGATQRPARSPAVLGLLVDHTQVAAPHPRLLHDLFDLGEAAARVAVTCLRAESVKDVARLLGISVNTVKSHLLTVYVKTGCTRRSQLIRLLSLLGEPQPGRRNGPPT
jgi:DNA-binding CsgD family transcriptional regulator